MSYKPIENFKFWCNKVLPLVYDDSLSYYEVLCKVVDYMNTAIDNLNYLNEIFAPLTGEIAQLETNFNQLKETVSASIIALNQRCTALEDAEEENYRALTLYVDSIRDGLQAQMSVLEGEYNAIVALYQSFKSYVDSGDVRTFNQSKAYTDARLKDILAYIDNPRIWFVVDPLDNQVKDIQTVINELFDLITWGAFTCWDFDSSGYDCDYIDSIGYTCLDFDYYGRFRFLYSADYITPEELDEYVNKQLEVLENYALKTDLNGVAYKTDLIMYNPITGYRDTFQQVIDALIALHACGNNAVTLDGLDYTATEYDTIGFSAFEFDFYGIIKTCGYYISPVTGERSPLQQILNQITALSAHGNTAEDLDVYFDTLDADSIDALQFTARDFDWYGIIP